MEIKQVIAKGNACGWNEGTYTDTNLGQAE